MSWLAQHKLLFLLLIAAAFTAYWLWTQRARLRMHAAWAIPLAICHVLIGVSCVKLFAMIEDGSFSSAGKMSLFGAVFFLPLVYAVGAKLTKRKAGDVFDVFVIAMVFTLACARVNCILSGCCLGRRIPGTDWRYPTRELELVFYAVLLIWFFVKTKKGDTGGQLYPLYMIAYGAFRFVVEFFREGRSSPFHLAHLWALLCLIAGAAIHYEQQQRLSHKKASTRKQRRKQR